ncbi:MAG: response regulator [Rhodoferax sp.]|nr:response regulator [Rhodoferax sp.]
MNIVKARILVVDDDRLMRAFIADILSRLGIQDVQECEDGAAGLVAAVKFRPDLILSDIHMQPMSGLEFVRKLRAIADSRTSATKVIFMSADASKETLGEALPLGILGYIVKPPRIEAVKAKIEAALK